MATTHRPFPIGSISEGTLRAQDLLRTFADTLESLTPEPRSAAIAEARELADLLDSLEDDGAEGTHERDVASELLDELMCALSDAAPDYVYFGTHEDDCACFGFWPLIDWMEEDAGAGDLLKVGDLADIPDEHDGLVMIVNDHGNVTLYDVRDGTAVDLWSCV